MSQLESFGMNIHLLIGLLACGGIGLVIAIILYTSIRAFLFHSRQKNAMSIFQKAKTKSDGMALPPVGSGICAQCNTASSKIYFLPDGSRLCSTCYESTRR
ncbi:MAG: hypothetical protein AABZ08_09015 [Planctomycetota bacterium]